MLPKLIKLKKNHDFLRFVYVYNPFQKFIIHPFTFFLFNTSSDLSNTDVAKKEDDEENPKEQTELSDFTIGQELITYVTGVYNFRFYYYSGKWCTSLHQK